MPAAAYGRSVLRTAEAAVAPAAHQAWLACNRAQSAWLSRWWQTGAVTLRLWFGGEVRRAGEIPEGGLHRQLRR